MASKFDLPPPLTSAPTQLPNDASNLKRSWVETEIRDACDETTLANKRSTPFNIPSSVFFSVDLESFEAIVGVPDIYIDKTGDIPLLPQTYRGLLVRPPGFGKTILLSTLAAYYDLYPECEDSVWENLAAARNAPEAFAARDRHLCLIFSLGDILPWGSPVERAIRAHIEHDILDFFYKYKAELGLRQDISVVEFNRSFDRSNIAGMFSKLWELVRSSGYKLFVGVDGFDEPFRYAALGRYRDFYRPPNAELRRNIETLLNTVLWSNLRGGMEVITKLLVTGVMSDTKTLENLAPFNLEQLDGLKSSCGFTEEEAATLCRRFRVTVPSSSVLQAKTGRHLFMPNLHLPPLLDPQRVFVLINELLGNRPAWLGFEPFVLLPPILEALEVEADDNRLTINALIDLLANGRIDPNISAPVDVSAIGPHALHDLGILTYDNQGFFRVANADILKQIHTTIRKTLDERYKVYDGFPHGLEPLLPFFSKVLLDQTRRGILRQSMIEPTMHGIMELTLEQFFQLIIDPLVLVPPEQIPTLTLRGLWAALHPNGGDPSFEALSALQEQLQTMSDAEIRDMSYRDEHNIVSRVEDHLKQAKDGIEAVVAVGGTRVMLPLVNSDRCEHCGRSGPVDV
ncbi:AAA family ATPase [Mycena indigotica]|uniref:AAA family ATPase n=1 Tax=Mycena indigotica TaxID=2126181 RepID=A0A8H6TF50_9AGAR|nr:AAA family ATPase [Mycena indigotica]KAF7316380.1 AAA family ATPase [Mycena indigotica]